MNATIGTTRIQQDETQMLCWLAGRHQNFFMCGRPKRNDHEPSVQVKWDAFCPSPLLVGSRLVQPDRGASAVAGEKESLAACLAVGVKNVIHKRPVWPPA